MDNTFSILETTSLTAVQSLIAERLLQLCQNEMVRAEALHPLYGRLWQSIADQVVGGGKRLRPYIVLLACEAYGCQLNSAQLDVAAAWEMLHISMLMHDDIIDRDYTRHGQLNVAGQYLDFYKHIENEVLRTHYAQSASLLAGDLVLSAAHQLIDRSQLESSLISQLKAILHEATFQVIGGELLDSEVSIVDKTIDLRIVAEAKTASYSLVGPLLAGATMAAATSTQLDLLRSLGVELGVGFQLADDILGVFGDSAKTGKSSDSDLAEGKRTMVVAVALQAMSASARAEAETLLADPKADHVSRLKQLIEQADVQTALAKQLADHLAAAKQIIEQLSINDNFKEELNKLSIMLLDRNV